MDHFPYFVGEGIDVMFRYILFIVPISLQSFEESRSLLLLVKEEPQSLVYLTLDPEILILS